MASGNDSVTIYCITSFGLGIGKAEGKLIDHGVKSPTSVQRGPFVTFMPPGKRKPGTIAASDGLPYLLILRGTGYPDPPRPFVSQAGSEFANGFSPSGGDGTFKNVYRFEGNSWNAFDPRYTAAFDEFINAYADRFIADYRQKVDSAPPAAAVHPIPPPAPVESPTSDDDASSRFDPAALEDERKTALAERVLRPGQAAFRAEVMKACQ